MPKPTSDPLLKPKSDPCGTRRGSGKSEVSEIARFSGAYFKQLELCAAKLFYGNAIRNLVAKPKCIANTYTYPIAV